MANYSEGCSTVGSFGYASRFTLYVELSNRDGNPATNKSIVDYHAYLENTSGGGTFTSQTRLYFTVNNSVIKDTTSSVTGPRNGRVEIASGSIEITHNDDGKKTIPFQALVKSTNYGVSSNIQNNFELTTIPRASSISCSTTYIGANPTINIRSASNSFTHTIIYSFFDLRETIATDLPGGNYTDWTIPGSFYSQIPDSPSGQGTIHCNTYSDGSLIGQTSTTFTVNTEESICKPNVIGSIKDINEKTLNLTGDETKIVRNVSTVLATIKASANKDSSIKTKSVNGIVISGNELEIEKSSASSFTFVAIDTRGYETSYDLTPDIIEYIPLSINANFLRPQPTTGEVKLTYSGKYFDGSFGLKDNSLTIYWKYKLASDEEWIDGGILTPEVKDNRINESTISLGTIFDYQEVYDFQLVAIDELNTVTLKAQVSAGIPIFNWGKDFFNVNAKLNLFGKNLLEIIFPIGSTYITQENLNPNEILGFGTWERSKGKVLIGLDENDSDFATIGKTGGEKKHIMTIDEMPKHRHKTQGYNKTHYGIDDGAMSLARWTLDGDPQEYGPVLEEGQSQPFNITQPYEVVGYMWIRRA